VVSVSDKKGDTADAVDKDLHLMLSVSPSPLPSLKGDNVGEGFTRFTVNHPGFTIFLSAFLHSPHLSITAGIHRAPAAAASSLASPSR
jgi:hypothetical protein